MLDLKVGNIETEACWIVFIRSLKERDLSWVKLVISNAHKGLTKPIRRVLHGSCW
jgi:putative transposase